MRQAVVKTKMLISKSRSKPSRARWSSAQNERFRELCETITALGVQVRREELKRGPCWKAQSGNCRLRTDRFVFVDSRLAPDEQLRFLAAQVSALKGPVESAR